MSPDEIETLRGLGLDIVRSFVGVTNESILLTIYGVLVLKASFVLLGKRPRKRSSVFTGVVILTMFIISVILWALDMANFIMEAKLTLIVNPDLPIDAIVR